jgi:glycine cleavage system H protein
MIPEELRYTTDHEWVRWDADGCITLGITDYAQRALGDVVFVQLPEADRTVASGEACAEVESIKSVAEVYAPLAGVVVEGNGALDGAPELLNADPYGEGWLLRLRPADPVPDRSGLLDAEAYRALTGAADG